MSWERLSDDQWEKVKKVIPKRKIPRKKKSRRGRKPVDDRKCFEGILWILWTGSPWIALPKIYEPRVPYTEGLRPGQKAE